MPIPTPDELVESAARTAPNRGPALARVTALEDGRVRLELGDAHRTVSAQTAYDDAAMAACWANLAAVTMATQAAA